MTSRKGITTTKKESDELLCHTRKRLITQGSEIAEEMLTAGGYVSIIGAQVFMEMDRRGITGLHDVTAHWLPLIFKNGNFEAVPSQGLYDGLGHDRLSHRWILRGVAI